MTTQNIIESWESGVELYNATTKREIVTMRRSARYANGRFKPPYYRVYHGQTLIGERSTRTAAENLKNQFPTR